MFFYSLPVLFLLVLSFVNSSPVHYPWEQEKPVTPKKLVFNRVVGKNIGLGQGNLPEGNVNGPENGLAKAAKPDDLSIQGHAEIQSGKHRTKNLKPEKLELFTVKGKAFDENNDKEDPAAPSNKKNNKKTELKGVIGIGDSGSQESKENGGDKKKQPSPYGLLPTNFTENPNTVLVEEVIAQETAKKRRPKKYSMPDFNLKDTTTEPPKGKKYRSEKIGYNWPLGIVWYKVDPLSFDKVLEWRVRDAMTVLESASCVQFKPLAGTSDDISWIHITNPQKQRECSHTIRRQMSGEVTMILGLDCLKRRDIIHSLLHAMGFNDEVNHPHRDQYIRVMWQNIQPKYQKLFSISPPINNLVEYDPMSIMHFHDRAFSRNGQATIVPLMSGLRIQPSDKLSQLDRMKLRIAFGHECNRRTVDNLVDSCKAVLQKEAGGDNDHPDNEETGEVAGGNNDEDQPNYEDAESDGQVVDVANDNDGAD